MRAMFSVGRIGVVVFMLPGSAPRRLLISRPLASSLSELKNGLLDECSQPQRRCEANRSANIRNADNARLR